MKRFYIVHYTQKFVQEFAKREEGQNILILYCIIRQVLKYC